MSDLERIFAGMGIEEEPDPTDDDAPACFDSLPTEIQEIILRQCSPHVRLVCKEWNALYIRGLSSLFPQGRDPSDQPRSLMLLHRFLRDARHLTVLNLSKFRWRRIHPMPAYILEAISSLPLVSLSLDGFDRLQDPDLARVLHPGPCVQNLRALDLGSCNCLTDASLMLVARLLGDRLRSLNLRFMQAAPQPLPGSTSLFATPAPVGPAPAGLTLPGLASFVLGGSMPHLRHLNLAIWAGLSQALLESIAAELPQLRSLTLAFGTTNPLGGPRSFAVSVLTGLRGATALQTLSLEGCHLIMGPPSPSNPFTAPPALEALDVSRASISPEIFDCIAQLTRLKSLGMFMLAETLDSDMITQKLTSLTRLERLDVSFCELSDAGLQHLACLPLRDLSLGSSGTMTDYGISFLLASATTLTRLDLSLNGRITDSAMHYIALSLRELRSIDISGCASITRDGIAMLARIPSLRRLNLSDLGIGTEEIAASLGPTWRPASRCMTPDRVARAVTAALLDEGEDCGGSDGAGGSSMSPWLDDREVMAYSSTMGVWERCAGLEGAT